MITIKRTFNPSGLLQVDDLRGEVFTGESGAHIFEISGVGVQLAGTVKGTFLAPNGVTIPLDGSAADGVVSMTLTEDCYVAPGRFILSIFLSSGSVTGCIYCGVGNVFRTQSDVISYPSASIPDIEQIIANAQAAAAQIQAEVTAAQAAVAAAQTAVDGIEDQRQTMIESIASVAGQGTDTTLTQSGVAADAKAAGDHISDLKSALSETEDAVDAITDVVYSKNRLNPDGIIVGYHLGENGELIESPDSKLTDFCFVEGFSNVYCWEKNSGYGQTMWYACAYDSDKNFKSYLGSANTFAIPSDVSYIRFNVGSTDTPANIMLESGTTRTTFEPYFKNVYVKTDDTLTQENEAADAKAVGDSINGISQSIQSVSDNVTEIKQTYDTAKNIITSSTEVNGKYINNEGTEAEQAGISYTQASIDSSLVGKEILVSGTGWYSIVPYVFVPTSGTPIYPSVTPGSTVTQYTDLSFTPQTTGTLYVNRYSLNPPQIAEAYYNEISNVKSEYITSIDNVKDAVSYKVVALEMTSGKLLNGNTGTITDNTNDAYRVSQYVEVNEDTDYLITTEHFWENGLYVWYDSNKNYISGVESQSGGTVTKIYCQKVRSPKNAAYLVIGFLYQPNFQFPFLMEGENKSIMPSKRWSGKKWTCIGDSLTEAYSVTGAHYFDLISAATGIETVNKGVSGTGYGRGTDNFMTRALTVPTDSDVVTFFGSGNDSGAGLPLGTASDTGTDTLGGCINTAIDNLYSIMPVVQLGIVTPTPWQGNMPSDDGWMARYSALIVEICNRRSIPCLDLFHCSNLNPNSAEVRQIAYARDNGGGVHPSEVGHAIIAPRFLAFLESLLMH